MKQLSTLALILFSACGCALAALLYVKRSRPLAASHFSHHLRDAILFSREETIRLGQPRIGCRHLLLGLLREEEGTAVKALHALGCAMTELKKAVENTFEENGTLSAPGNLPLTRAAEHVLNNISSEARRLGSGTTGTEHLLLSLLRDAGSPVASLLQQRFDVDYQSVRAVL